MVGFRYFRYFSIFLNTDVGIGFGSQKYRDIGYFCRFSVIYIS